MFSGLNATLIQQLFDSLEDETKKKTDVQSAKNWFTQGTLTGLATKLTSLSTPTNTGTLDALITVMNSIVAGSTTQANLNTLFLQYGPVLSLALDPSIIRGLDSYLTLLYEWRLVMLKKRLNKSNGTLIQVARQELGLYMLAPTIYSEAHPINGLITSDLPVVFEVTDFTLAQQAQYASSGLTPPQVLVYKATSATSTITSEYVSAAKVLTVYTPVRYKEDGKTPIIPPAGLYQLFSREYLSSAENYGLSPVTMTLDFTLGNPFQPPIIKDVITSIDPAMLVTLLTNPNLTMMEKVCAARVLQDWWKIDIPVSVQPLQNFYQNDLHLVLTPAPAVVDQWIATIGTGDYSPILETPPMAKPVAGITSFVSPDLVASMSTALGK
jgi:hypothetical protein